MGTRGRFEEFILFISTTRGSTRHVLLQHVLFTYAQTPPQTRTNTTHRHGKKHTFKVRGYLIIVCHFTT